MKNSSGGNFFSLPNEVFLLGLSPGELAVYSFLQRCENRKTHQCWPSIKTIGKAVGMSENTVRKYIRQLEERELIATEPTEVITKTKELTDLLRKNRTIDWQKKESARAGMRRLIKRLLKKHKYPPEGMDDAVQTVMSQCEMWTDSVF